METPFHSGGALRYGVVSDKQICVRCELCQSVALAVRISTKNDPLTLNFHSPCERRKPTMNHAHRVRHHVGVAEHEYWFGTCYDIMRFQCVASFCTFPCQVAQVTPRSARLTEKIVHELGRRRHKVVCRRTVYRQW